MTLLFMTVN